MNTIRSAVAATPRQLHRKVAEKSANVKKTKNGLVGPSVR
jgi:hypothetical protein